MFSFLRPRGAVALLAGMFMLAGCSPTPGASGKKADDDTVAVTTGLVESLPQDRVISVVGPLLPKDEATVSAEVEGRVEKIGVEIGDRLQNGQEMAQIDTTTYEAQSRLAAANLAKSQANAANAEQNLKRVDELRKSSIASQSEYDVAAAQAGAWRADIKAQEANAAIAELNLGKSHVKAPFAAGVSDRMVNVGDYVKVGAPLFRLVNDSALKLMVQVPDRYAGEVKLGQTLRFAVDAFPTNTFVGRIFLISPAINTNNQAFAVGAEVDNPQRLLKVRSYANGELIVVPDVATPMAPLDAVLKFAGVTKVFVVENGVAHSREIEVGRIRNGRQEITKGLRGGEQVVTSGHSRLQDGAKVKVAGGKSQ